jgi:hypothetical protein
MLVTMKIGKYAGEVMDIEPDSARQLIADGRASVPTYGEPETGSGRTDQQNAEKSLRAGAEPVSTPVKSSNRGKRK